MKASSVCVVCITGLLVCGGLSAPTQAANPVAAYPAPTSRDQAARKIGAVYPDKGYVVIEGQVFLLSSSTRVYRTNGATGGLTDLQKGMYVSIRVTATPASSKPVIEEIRILP